MSNSNNPLTILQQHWHRAKQNSPMTQPNSVSISTIDRQGFPQSRFVDLKQITEQGLVFCSRYDSNKGKEIEHNPKVALNVWWDHIGVQLRLSGSAEYAAPEVSDEFWQQRNLSAQYTTLLSPQSQPIKDLVQLKDIVASAIDKAPNTAVERPNNWGAFLIKPLEIEILTFAESRLHLRERFFKHGASWQMNLLAP